MMDMFRQEEGALFLKKHMPTGLWYEVNDTKARKTCSQKLREKVIDREGRQAKRAKYYKTS